MTKHFLLKPLVRLPVVENVTDRLIAFPTGATQRRKQGLALQLPIDLASVTLRPHLDTLVFDVPAHRWLERKGMMLRLRALTRLHIEVEMSERRTGPDELWEVAVQDVEPASLVRLVRALRQHGFDLETVQVVRVEVALDGRLKAHTELDDDEARRAELFAAMVRHFWVPPASTATVRDSLRWIGDNGKTVHARCAPRKKTGGADGDPYRAIDPDATLYLVKRGAPLHYRIMRKRTDRRRGKHAHILPNEKRCVRIEAVISGSELGACGIERLNDLMNAGRMARLRRFFDFQCPVLADPFSTSGLQAIARKELLQIRADYFVNAGVWAMADVAHRATLKPARLNPGTSTIAHRDLNNATYDAFARFGERFGRVIAST